jgi:hypothetical protein
MKSTLRIMLATTFCFVSASASAADWYVFPLATALSGTSAYFFDLESVIQSDETTILWLKTIHDKALTRGDQVYSVAQLIVFSCKQRRTQVVEASTYDKRDHFIKSVKQALSSQEIIPGSRGELIFKAICNPRFPKNGNEDSYARAFNQNINQMSSAIFERTRVKPLEQETDTAPK